METMETLAIASLNTVFLFILYRNDQAKKPGIQPVMCSYYMEALFHIYFNDILN